jgi:hypothetical protein
MSLNAGRVRSDVALLVIRVNLGLGGKYVKVGYGVADE